MKTRIIFGIFVIAYMSFAASVAIFQSCKKIDALPENYPENQITRIQANAKLKLKSISPINYFKVNLKQLKLMQTIADQNRAAVAFKLYPTDSEIIIMGQDSTGNMIDIPIFITGTEQSGPCPYLCDER